MKGRSLDPAVLRARLAERFAALFGETEPLHEPAQAQRRAEFAARMAAECQMEDNHEAVAAGTERVARLAAWLDGNPSADGGESEEWCTPEALEDALSSLSFIERVVEHSSRVPAERVDAVLETWRRTRGGAGRGAEVLPLRQLQSKSAIGLTAPMADSFLLLAAADGTREPAIVCRSQSGLWTLEVFVETSEHGGHSGAGYLLLSVHPDHRMTYEGRNARVFVGTGDAERVLVDAPVRGGEVYAPIALAGLDLWTRDAVNVVFTACPNGS